MAIKLPERNYFTVPEIMTRWQCTENDIRQIIINGTLKPSYFISDNREYSQIKQMDGLSFVLEVVKKELRFSNAGFYYLHMGAQIGSFDCHFGAFSKSREAYDFARSDSVNVFTLKETHGNNFFMKESLSLAEVLKNGVITMEELVIVERELASHNERQHSSNELGNRERDTLLTIIAALCKDVGYDYTKHAKTAGLIQSTAAKMGASIGETTIENHLKKIPDALANRMK